MLAVASGVMTYWDQRRTGAVADFDAGPLVLRVGTRWFLMSRISAGCSTPCSWESCTLILLRSRRGRWNEAVAQFSETVHLQPGYEDALVSLGGVLAAAGRIDDAKSRWEAVLKIDPNNQSARIALEQLSGMK